MRRAVGEPIKIWSQRFARTKKSSHEVRKINFFKVGLRTRTCVDKMTFCDFKMEKLKLFETWKFKMRFQMRHAVVIPVYFGVMNK